MADRSSAVCVVCVFVLASASACSSGGGGGGSGATSGAGGSAAGGGVTSGGGKTGGGGSTSGGSGGALPAGACANPGGLFGDYVDDGGYRCAPGPQPIYEIQVCHSGAWSTASTCNCQVTIGSSQQDTQCFDIDFKDVARCEYGVDYCYECDPSAGCHSW